MQFILLRFTKVSVILLCVIWSRVILQAFNQRPVTLLSFYERHFANKHSW
jgi:hypothetical protein